MAGNRYLQDQVLGAIDRAIFDAIVELQVDPEEMYEQCIAAIDNAIEEIDAGESDD